MSDETNQVRSVLEHIQAREAQVVALFAVDVSFLDGATEPTITAHAAPAGVNLSPELSDEWHEKFQAVGDLLRRAYLAGEFSPRA